MLNDRLVLNAAEADDTAGGAGPAKRIKVEGGWSGQPEIALPTGAANCLVESALCCLRLITAAKACYHAPAMPLCMRVASQLLGYTAQHAFVACWKMGLTVMVGWAADTLIKPGGDAALADDGVPVQAVKQSTPLTDALNGADGGTGHLSLAITLA